MRSAQPAAKLTSVRPMDSAESGEPMRITLLDLVRSVAEVTEDEREVVATVIHMLKSKRVRLCGNFRDRSPDEFSR